MVLCCLLGKALSIRRWIWIATVAVPLIILGILIGVYYPKAPRVVATDATFNTVSLRTAQSISVDMDIQLVISNENNGYGISFDPINVTFYFPDNPSKAVGDGVIPGGMIEKGQSLQRSMHAAFSAPWSDLGSQFLTDMNKGYSTMEMKGRVLGYTPSVGKDVRLASDVFCTMTYHWQSGLTSHSCEYKQKVRLSGDVK